MINRQELIESMEKDREIAERYLLDYDECLTEYNAKKREALNTYQPPDENVGGGRSNVPGHPVEAAAVRFADYDAEHSEYAWLRAVEYTRRTLGERKNMFIKARRAAKERAQRDTAGRPAWVEVAAQIYFELVCGRFIERPWDKPPSARTVKLWWAQIIERTVEIHLRLEKK